MDYQPLKLTDAEYTLAGNTYTFEVDGWGGENRLILVVEDKNGSGTLDADEPTHARSADDGTVKLFNGQDKEILTTYRLVAKNIILGFSAGMADETKTAAKSLCNTKGIPLFIESPPDDPSSLGAIRRKWLIGGSFDPELCSTVRPKVVADMPSKWSKNAQTAAGNVFTDDYNSDGVVDRAEFTTTEGTRVILSALIPPIAASAEDQQKKDCKIIGNAAGSNSDAAFYLEFFNSPRPCTEETKKDSE